MTASTHERCYGCFRPRRLCFCHAIPAIANRTEVVILQHMRERFHPFNTARILHRALRKATLLAHPNDELARVASEFPWGNRAGVLYPSPHAQVLSQLPADQHPHQLVVIDGTWHHAKTLMRDIPVLERLPRYCLKPSQPSRYRIRREPSETALSTIEAAVQALQTIEPQTLGWEALLAAFDTMVEQQLGQMQGGDRWRKNHRRRSLPNANFPRVLLRQPEHVVVAYGESTGDSPQRPPQPILWTAQRVGSGERFRCAIRPPQPLSPTLLGHMGLNPSDFEHALSLPAFGQAWQQFLHPQDTLVVYHMSTARLLTAAGLSLPRCLTLKSIKWNGARPQGTLEQVLERVGVERQTDPQLCRAELRLQNALRYMQYLRDVNDK